jgi:hypothetical protein
VLSVITAAGCARRTRIDRSKASAAAAARERHVHGAMRATMNRGRREASNPNLMPLTDPNEKAAPIPEGMTRLSSGKRESQDHSGLTLSGDGRAFKKSPPAPTVDDEE